MAGQWAVAPDSRDAFVLWMWGLCLGFSSAVFVGAADGLSLEVLYLLLIAGGCVD